MILFNNNEIDKKIASTYSIDVINEINHKTNGYVGLNIDSSCGLDVDTKVYYNEIYTGELYKKYKNSDIVDYFLDNNFVEYFDSLYLPDMQDSPRYNVKFCSRTNKDMEQVLNYLSKRIWFFTKYEKEIFGLSKMKISEEKDLEYASLFFMGLVYKQKVLKTLKCYWLNKHRELPPESSDAYYLSFLENNFREYFVNIIPLVKRVIENCSAHLWMTGLDFSENSIEKQKIYVDNPINLFDGLEKSFMDFPDLQNKINLVKNWHEIHSEFFCEGLAIGQNNKEHITINFYFKLKDCRL